MTDRLKTDDFKDFTSPETQEIQPKLPVPAVNVPQNNPNTLDKPIFPSIDSAKMMPFLVIKQQFLKYPELLNHPSCPYSQDVKDLLGILRKGLMSEIIKDFDEDDMSLPSTQDIEDIFQSGNVWDVLLAETQKIYVSLVAHRKRVDAPGASADKATSYYKNLVSLIEKMVELNKEVMQLKEISAFKALVLEIFDTILLPDQREEYMERLKTAMI